MDFRKRQTSTTTQAERGNSHIFLGLTTNGVARQLAAAMNAAIENLEKIADDNLRLTPDHHQAARKLIIFNTM
jgi:hypothetical protein